MQRPHHHLHGQTEPPRGMRVTEDDLRLLTTESPAEVEAVFTQLNSDMEALQRQIQKNRQVSGPDLWCFNLFISRLNALFLPL